MELEKYAQAVEENYQSLADILLDASSDALVVERLLSLDFLTVPPMKRGYAIWSEGIWAEAMACFPPLRFRSYWSGCEPPRMTQMSLWSTKRFRCGGMILRLP